MAALSLATGLALVLAVVALVVGNARIAAREAETTQALAREGQARDDEERLLYLERVASASRLWSDNQAEAAEQRLGECPPRFRRWE